MPKTNLHFITFLFVFLTHTPAYAEWYKANKAIMGTAINVELWHDNKKIAEANIQRVFDEMHRIDRLMSPYKQNSEVSLINANASNHPLKISSELFELIKKSINISKLSNGAFDITFASVGYMYDYRKKQQPTKEEISKRLKSINYQNIKLDSSMQSIFFTQANTRIDLGGIAKGHAVDNAIKLLQQHGIKQAMISAGGDTRIIGDKNGRPWYVGIRHPRNKNKSAVILPLNNTAISTSGDYERYFIKDNIRHHHIINPSTGDSARELRSVSILGSNSTTTDALSTTVFILGLQKGMKLVSSLKDIEAIIIDNNGQMHYSSGLKPAK
ncbi:MAG: FAD:protein FMN transferase [Gammaproteobacteria bacterium]|nr:FAD:protein FMN transferase [Gammaproteobacteria bacterium]